ncbi:hypothetical protein BD309DRAFT_1023626 [Dichomitus squalens]|nr:hypothetical protein BD309DRAFT_1023626 [Dichomitus squalens]
MPAKQDYECDCAKYCHGQLHPVSRGTYYSHRPYRIQALQQALHNALEAGESGNATGIQTTFPRGTKRRRTNDQVAPTALAGPSGYGSGSGPPQLEFHGGEDPNDADERLDADPFPFQDAELEPPFFQPVEAEPSDPAQQLPGAAEEPANEEPEYGSHDETGPLPKLTLEELKNAMAFNEALKHASLEGSGLDPKVIERMCNPERDGELPDLTAPENRVLRLALKQFILNGHSEQSYRDNRDSFMEFYEGLELPSYEAMQKTVQELSGVVPIVTDMCPKTCLAYTGPFAGLDRCPYDTCGEARYEMQGKKRVARRTFQTHPLGPQLQALYRSRHCAKRMHYRERVMEQLLGMADAQKMVEVAEDVFFAEEYIKLVASGTIREDDLVLMFSLDGAQLYESKQSDCWIYIWVLFDLSPDIRYKKRILL